MKKKPKALGSYIFAGGFTVGMQDHFEIVAHVENGDYGVATVKRNFPKLPVYTKPSDWPLEQWKGIPLVYGNPACAAWSQAGYSGTRGTDKWRTDPRLAQTLEHFSLLETLQPDIWCWESVTQAYSKGQEFVKELEARAVALGYHVTYFLHDTQWMGLPQVRKRFIMICHRVEIQLPTHNWAPPPTPVEVLEGSPVGVLHVKNQFNSEKILEQVIPGERLTKWWEREVGGSDESKWVRNPNGTVKGRPSFGECRLPLDRPSGAVVGYSMIHPTEHRFLSTEEMQRLSGFPDDYVFTAKAVQARASEIARGVCPPVGAYLGSAFAAALDRGKSVSDSVIREIDYRRPPVADESLITTL